MQSPSLLPSPALSPVSLKHMLSPKQSLFFDHWDLDVSQCDPEHFTIGTTVVKDDAPADAPGNIAK